LASILQNRRPTFRRRRHYALWIGIAVFVSVFSTENVLAESAERQLNSKEDIRATSRGFSFETIIGQTYMGVAEKNIDASEEKLKNELKKAILVKDKDIADATKSELLKYYPLGTDVTLLVKDLEGIGCECRIYNDQINKKYSYACNYYYKVKYLKVIESKLKAEFNKYILENKIDRTLPKEAYFVKRWVVSFEPISGHATKIGVYFGFPT